MDAFDSERLVLAWWNTSLSPKGKRRPALSEQDRSYVLDFIKEFVHALRVDILALGEVQSEDISDIIEAIGDSRLSFHDATVTANQKLFDIGVLFDRRRLLLDTHLALLDSHGRSTLKVGEKVSFVSNETGECLHLVVSHWPSRLHVSETDAKRQEIAISLRKKLDQIRSGSSSRQFIVLLGDYNDDPCSPSLAHHLLATRDRDLARDNDRYIYNPFWRRLGEAVPFRCGQTLQSICGTYFYSRGSETRWFTFDQIMFSSAFLHDGPFILNEESCLILRSDDLESRIRSPAVFFDHLPVVATIEIRREA